ncbi:hypothetical protein [Streptomyces sp. SP18CS02]|uniref:hypothetical protein n=1 Tax=Streptomyces sp. SP18CS02 TaxID=3002531 RepID=UPI002E79F248|nr:hypothetical protein [Streptomyces sp. SP18CS02]MEE1751224.1 hypothetical protein [Streptomyces sp. SP18CS02]
MAGERVRWPAVVDRARQIVESYEGDVALRQVMYRLVSAGVLPHTPSMYRRLSSRLAQARREVHVPSAWPDAGAFLGEAVDWFALDRTRGQKHALYVATDAHRLACRVRHPGPGMVRGFDSQSYVDIVRERTARDPRAAHLLYVGDFDCSGEDIERDWVQRTGCWSRVERMLLTRGQVLEYELPATEGKSGDSRWPGFARRYDLDPARPVRWEVEALKPDELQRLLLAAVDPYIDRPVLARQIAREEAARLEAAAPPEPQDGPEPDQGRGWFRRRT